jgi:hypothetical protein
MIFEKSPDSIRRAPPQLCNFRYFEVFFKGTQRVTPLSFRVGFSSGFGACARARFRIDGKYFCIGDPFFLQLTRLIQRLRRGFKPSVAHCSRRIHHVKSHNANSTMLAAQPMGSYSSASQSGPQLRPCGRRDSWKTPVAQGRRNPAYPIRFPAVSLGQAIPLGPTKESSGAYGEPVWP